jgi:Domain of unknown function (DUF4157)
VTASATLAALQAETKRTPAPHGPSRPTALRTDRTRSLRTRPSSLPPAGSSMLRRCACGGVTGPSGECAACRARREAASSQLEVGRANDPAEHEAERFAAQVTGTPSSGAGRSPSAPGPSHAPSSVQRVLSTPGRPLEPAARSFFEGRIGRGLGDVRVHDDAAAASSASDVNARAYAVGDDVVFARGEYAPETPAGLRLLAHELAHVGRPDSARSLRRTSASCPPDWRTTVADDHARALSMIGTARTKLSSYNGTTPTEVNTALATHFHATSSAFGGWVSFNLAILQTLAHLASYDCEDSSSWWCKGDPYAKTMWCVPGFDIRVCHPNYFPRAPADRSTTLIHEWVHKYGCNFDLGYESEPGYSTSWTITALLNAAPFAGFVRDVQ